MKSIQLMIENKVGLHARPAALFVKMAKQHNADITVSYEEKTVNAKSILGLLSLGVKKDAIITVVANGSDEEVALHALSKLIEGNFGE